MSGNRFCQSLFFWVLMMALGATAIWGNISGTTWVLYVLFGATWLGLSTYWAWKIGNVKEDV